MALHVVHSAYMPQRLYPSYEAHTRTQTLSSNDSLEFTQQMDLINAVTLVPNQNNSLLYVKLVSLTTTSTYRRNRTTQQF